MKSYKGKIIYNPEGRASEYGKWAANFYNGCSGDCTYCYMKKGVMSTNWSTTPTLKKQLIDDNNAFKIFKKECLKNKESLQKHGLFFNFNSDPFLPNSFWLNWSCIRFAMLHEIPVKALTKQTYWLMEGIALWPLLHIGFTLTGHDEKEPGCSTNAERINAMIELKERGFKTWASIEPIIDFESSFKMIMETRAFCDHYKIGLESGKKYNISRLRDFMGRVNHLTEGLNTIYYKDDLLGQAMIARNLLPYNCVGRDYLIKHT